MQPQERFFSMNKPLDWHTGYASNLDIGEAAVSVHRSDTYTLHRIVRGGDIEGAHRLTDIAVAPGSKLYALDELANVWAYDMQNRLTEPLFRHGHRLFSEHAMLAAAGDVLFIADAQGERRLAAVSPTNGQLIWARQDWLTCDLYPLAIAADRRKHAFVLVPLDFQIDAEGRTQIPAGGSMALLEWDEGGNVANVYEHESLRLSKSASIHELRGRYHIAVTDGGEPVLWNSETGIVTVFRGESASAFAAISDARGKGFTVDSAGNGYIGGVADNGEDDRCIVKLPLHEAPFVKLRGYRGGADKLLFDTRDRMYAWDADAGDIAILDLQSRTTELEDIGLPMAVFLSAELDCTEEETVWHKITLDADIPEETQVRVSYFASDRRDGILEGKWVVYSDYLRDPEVPLRDKLRASSRLWSEPIVNPRDALLRGAKGRYLWLKLELAGSFLHAPSVRKLRVYFPRTSLLDYLPPIYQEDRGDEQFLERFLALFGTFFSEMETTIDRISNRFDPDAVSGDYLKWLSGWLAVESPDDWTETKLRELMKQAPDLYKRRGTREGLSRMLRIYTGKEPFIVEYHQVKAMQESSELRQLFERLYGDNPYCFTVMLSPECIRTDKQRLMIEHIIDDQKPAYAEGRLIVLEPWMYADVHTYLGINTVLSEPTLLTLDQRSAMPYQTLLVDVDRDRRMDVHTRLELDSELD